MSIWGQWLPVTVTKDDDPALSGEVDLGQEYEYLNILIPTIDSANVSLYVARELGGTYYQLGLATNVFAAGTGGLMTTFELGGYRFIKVLCSAVQTTSSETFYVRGYRC
jgi:hypothetical protein